MADSCPEAEPPRRPSPTPPAPPPSLAKRQVRTGRTKERFRDGSESAAQRKGEAGQAIPGKRVLPRGWFLSGIRVDPLQM